MCAHGQLFNKAWTDKVRKRQRLSQTAADQASRRDATMVPIQSSKKKPQFQRPNIVIREH